MKAQRISLAALAALVFAGTAPAIVLAQVPEVLGYTGFLSSSDGEPFSGAVDIDCAIFESVDGGTAIWTESFAEVDVATGWFGLELDAAGAVDWGDSPELLLSLTIDGEELTPRQRIGTVPYAAVAGTASSADDAGGALLARLEELEARVADLEAGADAPVAWSDITGVPEEIADGDDGITEVLWSEIVGVPEEIADGDDRITEVYWSAIVDVPTDIADGDDGLTEV